MKQANNTEQTSEEELNDILKISSGRPIDREVARQQLLSWKDAAVVEARKDTLENATICGKSVEEIVVILNGLSIERETGIEVTMSNLQALYNRLLEDMSAANQKAIDNVLSRYTHKEKGQEDTEDKQ